MDVTQLVKQTELYLLDMDGTLYLGDQLFSFTKEFLATVRKAGKKYLFLTNNSSKSVSAYVEKLGRLGISATEEDFLTSSQATARYLQEHYAGKRLYVCGTRSLKEELMKNGFTVTEDLEETECIVMGYDTELTYKKLDDVSRMLCTRELPYIATNPDYVCPTEYGSVPDCGSVCDMIYNATKKRPFVIGKPSPMMPMLAAEKAGVSVEHTAVLGDRIYTDVKSALNAGAVGVLVMSGETTPEILAASEDKPDLVIDSAAVVLEELKKQMA